MRRDFHFNGTTTGNELGVNEDVLSNGQTVVEVSFHFVEDVLGGTSQNDGTSFGVFAFGHESEVFITNKLNFEQTALLTNIRFLDFFRSVDDGSTRNSGNSIVIGLSDSSDNGDVLL